MAKRIPLYVVVVPILVGVLVVGLLATRKTIFNVTGANQRKAQREASKFASEDMTLGPDPKVDCKKHDSDGDGEITCTLFGQHERVTLECPTRRWIRALEDSGCRETERITGNARLKPGAVRR